MCYYGNLSTIWLHVSSCRSAAQNCVSIVSALALQVKLHCLYLLHVTMLSSCRTRSRASDDGLRRLQRGSSGGTHHSKVTRCTPRDTAPSHAVPSAVLVSVYCARLHVRATQWRCSRHRVIFCSIATSASTISRCHAGLEMIHNRIKHSYT